MRIAIHPDHTRVLGDTEQSFSDVWFSVARERGYDAVAIDAYAPSAAQDLRAYDAFMWRFAGHDTSAYAGRFMLAIHQAYGIKTFPEPQHLWHMSDKSSGQYLLEAAGVPTPKTWSFFNKEQALGFLDEASYPLVIKLSGTAGQSVNVGLVRSKNEGRRLVNVIFSCGIKELWQASGSFPRILARHLRYIISQWNGRKARHGALIRGSCVFQEYVPGCNFDLRATVIGPRVIPYKRWNRPNDFRASGSGAVEYCPSEFSEGLAHKVLEFSRKLGMQFVTFDILMREGAPLVIELNYNYVARIPNESPGYWLMRHGEMSWVHQSPQVERATLDEFVESN